MLSFHVFLVATYLTPLVSTFPLHSPASISKLTSHSTVSPSSFFWKENMSSLTPYSSSASSSPPARRWQNWPFFTLYLLTPPPLRCHPQCLCFHLFSQSVMAVSQLFFSTSQNPALLPCHRYQMFMGMMPPHHRSFLISHLSDLDLPSSARGPLLITISILNCRLLVSTLASPIFWFAFEFSPGRAYHARLPNFSIFPAHVPYLDLSFSLHFHNSVLYRTIAYV